MYIYNIGWFGISNCTFINSQTFTNLLWCSSQERIKLIQTQHDNVLHEALGLNILKPLWKHPYISIHTVSKSSKGVNGYVCDFIAALPKVSTHPIIKQLCNWHKGWYIEKEREWPPALSMALSCRYISWVWDLQICLFQRYRNTCWKMRLGHPAKLNTHPYPDPHPLKSLLGQGFNRLCLGENGTEFQGRHTVGRPGNLGLISKGPITKHPQDL